MKIAIALCIIATFLACTDRDKIAQLEEKNAQLEAEYNLLTKEATMKDEYIEEYTKTINDVYDNLERIRKREGFITKISKDLEQQDNTPIKEKMMSNLESIDNYLKKSKTQLQQLKQNYSSTDQKITSLEETVDKLTGIIEEKEQQAAALREQVTQLNMRVAEVEQELQSKDEFIATQTEKLNTGYYIIGTARELKEKGIVIEKGGFLGINKTKKLSDVFNTNDFIATDIQKTEVISVGQGVKAELISPHNPDSFYLVEDESEELHLEIIDPEEFWKINYLVILTKS